MRRAGERLTIRGKGPSGKGYEVALNGMELQFVTELELTMSTIDANTVTLRLLIDEVDVDAEALVALQADARA